MEREREKSRLDALGPGARRGQRGPSSRQAVELPPWIAGRQDDRTVQAARSGSPAGRGDVEIVGRSAGASDSGRRGAMSIARRPSEK